MSEAKATLTYARIAPRKVNIVADLIRGKDIDLAVGILNNTPKKASPLLVKLVNSAAANAENNSGMDRDKLYVSAVYVNPGPIMKRMQPVSKGRGYRIDKRTSHITVVVSEKA
ncbi:MAG: 50S ribosomal protein L22 [Clostridiales bacterium]|nr:50S ribosomal protein L22 [Clostridiales bacterium]